MKAPGSGSKERRLTWASGGWILLTGMLLVSAVMIWRILDIVGSRGSHAVGDGSNPRTYGFDLDSAVVPESLISATGMPRDGLPVLDLPSLIGPSQVDSMAEKRRHKYLVSGDRVLGVVIGGQARAYPLRVLNWHEVINDTLGGAPVAVTYNPLTDAAAVYRRIGSAAGDTLWFGHSGLLYNSNLLMYDRRSGGSEESLWAQLSGRAVSGPAAQAGHRLEALPGPDAQAGHRLEALPCAVMQWADWREIHPGTTVLARDETREDRYKRNPYVSYYGSDQLRFPAAPLPPKGRLAYKDPVLVVRVGEMRRIFPLDWLAGAVDAEGRWKTELGGVPLSFHYRDDPPTAWVRPLEAGRTAGADRHGTGTNHGEALVNVPAGGGERIDWDVRQAFWFAWYALEPGDAALSISLAEAAGMAGDPTPRSPSP